MKRKVVLSFIMVAVITASMTVGAFAAENLTEIKAYLNASLKFNLDGELWSPKDIEGNDVLPITYNGTTYLPVRSSAEALGLSVGWDDTTQTVTLTKQNEVTNELGGELYEGEYLVGDFKISNVYINSGLFGTHVWAEITNTSNNIYYGVVISLTYLNEDNEEIGSAKGFVNKLDVGKSSRIFFLNVDGISGLDSIEFNVHGTLPSSR